MKLQKAEVLNSIPGELQTGNTNYETDDKRKTRTYTFHSSTIHRFQILLNVKY